MPSIQTQRFADDTTFHHPDVTRPVHDIGLTDL